MEHGGWKAFVIYNMECDRHDLFVRRSPLGGGYGHMEWLSVKDDGTVIVTRTTEAIGQPPVFARGLDPNMLKALALAIDEHFGKSEATRVQEARTAAAEGAADYAKGLNERFIGILERQVTAG